MIAPHTPESAPMLIDCPSCARSYHVSSAELDGGRTVICPRCDARWFVAGEGVAEALEPSLDDIRTEGISRRPPADLPPHLGNGPRHGLRLTMAVVACLVVLMGMIGARQKIVRLMPRTEALYAAAGMPVNVRGLVFAAVMPTRVDPAAAEVTISGEIRNVAQRRVYVPRVAYEVRDAAGVPLVQWSERAPATTLAAGRTLAFASSPHTMPPESRSVLVRFETDDAAPSRRVAALGR